jgi:CheY-like chemotaxis protein
MGNKLLLADDSITIQKVVGIIFANEDYELTVVDSGIAAMEKARELVPDIILIDALMPGKNGYEVCEEVRRDPTLKHIPLLLLTGAFEPFDEERARQCGADDSISKPFESQHLIDKVRALIAQGKERAKAQPEPELAAPAPRPVEVSDVTTRELTAAAPVEALPLTETAAGETAWDFFTAEEERGEDIFATELSVAEEVIEVTPDEDLWGAFDVEEVTENEAFAIEETAEELPVEVAAGLTTEEAFSFAEEEPGPAGAGVDLFAAPQEFMPLGEPAAEDVFTFAEEPGLAAAEGSGLYREEAGEDIFTFADEPAPQGTGTELFAAPLEFIPPEEPATEDFFSLVKETPAAESDAVFGADVFSVEPEGMVPGVETTEEFLAVAAVPQSVAEEREESRPQPLTATPEVERQFAPEEEYVPAFSAAPAAAAVPAPVSGDVTLSDEQLTALVSRISRDILEKIAWEVVPDLAETIIREEIRKIKEAQ